jgi:hypothetical protein
LPDCHKSGANPEPATDQSEASTAAENEWLGSVFLMNHVSI